MSSTDHHDVVIALTTDLGTTTSRNIMVVEDQTTSNVLLNQHVAANNATTSAGVNNNNNKPARRTRRGKIKMEKIKRENNLLVTFSKRKSGLMKKANELCTMCGVQCALVIFSPAGKVFSFGHPSVEQVADRYLSGNPNPINLGQQRNEASQSHTDHQTSTRYNHVDDLMSELRELEAVMEAAKKHGRELDDKRAMRRISCWWERQLQELNGGQIETLKRGVVDLKSQVSEMAKLRLMPPLVLPTPAGSRSLLGGLGRSLNDPDFHGAGGGIILSGTFPFGGGFPTWNKNNHNAAGPSGHAHASVN